MIPLPYPISTNRYWRNFRGRMVVSKEAVAYKRLVAIAARYAGLLTPFGPEVEIEVAVQIHPKTTKSGAASKARVDIDNAH